MTPVRKRRLIIASLVLAAGLIAGTLVVLALGSNLAYLYTPAEVLAGEASQRASFRLGGMVKQGSVERIDGTLETRFVVTDGDADMLVSYSGILPDLFRDAQSVIATGSLQDGHFVATEVLAKHDETYMPREVAEKMEASHKKHNVADNASGVTATAVPDQDAP